MKAVFMTDQGKVRQHNEDNGGIYVNSKGQRLAIVADGMGGHRAGDVASEMTLTSLKGFWDQTDDFQTAEEAEGWLRKYIAEVNTILYEHSKENEQCEGMGTTVVAAICTDRFATIANIGDSRCYILNESGFQQLTEDHSLVNELVRSGQITKEDAEHHPRKNVLLRALGTEAAVEMDIKTITFEEGDLLLLCSDGLSNKVDVAEMIEILKSGRTLEEKASVLIEQANNNGGEDNITLVIAEYFESNESGMINDD
ncbi:MULTISPECIES: Stp1/IreP family PP2C-type Ser/Thr phosphatase [Cytobacillus]|uniref:protein-serine/threonine phosphatase n=1 Tax=Cytobacillus oceanisediminis 2691 TaxID=1196031 RepID=A0A160MAR9_9BACI|nr:MULTISPECIES: Stp1/IreP family PP2C-type Ser/Thr phosphatase [Cytobacillus]MBY0157460.1 Stp1/IreP family PP2C-type Ser/Thr phosphatase [Cytobacillus firmus]AND39338.1 protein phosphatase [Cytobacillus oceanisediminis 2691]MCM3394170.1 Stp1/IreP family PP2C-type Ser/Thr phosphatase [Cytobacillus oceanisediminis]MCM3528049.1 Stp1/IreP family PP2C-type Ser/Thr phosphatase [Cytobacillus oceanisediminis]UQX56275.1 Stp1/IreP family PP2C-type Ser/Thr phosphatase [Cytobacillus pseudoceanisediminis]